MATPVPFGAEFLVNAVTLSTQQESAITALADGRFVVCWRDQSGTDDVSATGIRAQVFNADGSLAGLSFPVNTITSGHQELSSVTALDNGGFVVCWQDQSASGGDTSSEAIRAQVFNAAGGKSGLEFLVNTTTTFGQRDPAITALSGGNFVVTWRDGSNSADDASGGSVRAQIFTADGTKSGAEFRLNSTILQEQSDPSIVGLAGGGFAACWMDWSTTGGAGGDPSGKAIRARVFDANGAAVGNAPDFVVNSTTLGDQHEPGITALANGGFAVSWTDGLLSNSNTSVYAKVFDATGAATSAEFLVNTTAANNQHDSSSAGLADGRVVFCWVDFSAGVGDTVGSAIRAQVFNLDGSKSGDEFLVNTITTGNQSAPAIATLADGRFMVSWTDGSGTLGSVSDKDVRGQIFDPREAAVNLKGTTLADQWIGTAFNDIMSGAKGKDQLRGEDGVDRINGGKSDDVISGGNGADKLTGGLGRDTLTGDAGADDFIFVSAAESGAGASRDVIADFEHLVDDIALGGFLVGGSYIGKAAFGNVAGQVRYGPGSGILQVDVDGNGAADFEIRIANKPVITSDDFIF